jgi:uncharacterized protein (DUF2344 family)
VSDKQVRTLNLKPMNRLVSNKFIQEVLTEQATEMAVNLFISELQNKATKEQQRRLITLLEEINSNKAPIIPVAELKYA